MTDRPFSPVEFMLTATPASPSASPKGGGGARGEGPATPPTRDPLPAPISLAFYLGARGLAETADDLAAHAPGIPDGCSCGFDGHECPDLEGLFAEADKRLSELRSLINKAR